jgi:hypothetical protein
MKLEADDQNNFAANRVLDPADEVTLVNQATVMDLLGVRTNQKLRFPIPHVMIPVVTAVSPENGTHISRCAELLKLTMSVERAMSHSYPCHENKKIIQSKPSPNKYAGIQSDDYSKCRQSKENAIDDVKRRATGFWVNKVWFRPLGDQLWIVKAHR